MLYATHFRKFAVIIRYKIFRFKIQHYADTEYATSLCAPLRKYFTNNDRTYCITYKTLIRVKIYKTIYNIAFA